MTLGLGRYNRKQPPPTNSVHSFVAPYVFEGGARIGWSNWTVPFARLTADPEMVMVSVRSLPFGHSPVWIDRADVTLVVRVQGCLVSPGIMFETQSGDYDGLIFWTFSPRKVLGSLRYLGWPTTEGKILD